jgi:hypothetical protein
MTAVSHQRSAFSENEERAKAADDTYRFSLVLLTTDS